MSDWEQRHKLLAGPFKEAIEELQKSSELEVTGELNSQKLEGLKKDIERVSTMMQGIKDFDREIFLRECGL